MKIHETIIKRFLQTAAVIILGAGIFYYSTTIKEEYSDPAEELEEAYDAISKVFYEWYFDIGTSLPAGETPDYSRYSLYDVVEKGDIIFEEVGGFAVTGHIAIVEGKFCDEETGINYIRVIEAKNVGVVRSCLDDTRADDKIVTVLRVKGVTKEQIDGAVDFCISQLGKPYVCDLGKDFSPYQDDWYCSELAWAAYYNQGIDIECQAEGEPGVSPRDIRESEKTFEVFYK